MGGGLRVTAGNVGIGTLTPGANLVVNGNAQVVSNLSVGANTNGPSFEQLSVTGSSGLAAVGLHDPTQALDQKLWNVYNKGGQFRILAVNDALTQEQDALTISRSGYADQHYRLSFRECPDRRDLAGEFRV